MDGDMPFGRVDLLLGIGKVQEGREECRILLPVVLERQVNQLVEFRIALAHIVGWDGVDQSSDPCGAIVRIVLWKAQAVSGAEETSFIQELQELRRELTELPRQLVPLHFVEEVLGPQQPHGAFRPSASG
jgi:hypothetical protein